MPPINTPGSRASLVTAVVAFAILFVTSAIFAIYFEVKFSATELALADAQKQTTGIYSEAAASSPEVVALQSLKTDPASGFNANSTVMDMALQQRDELAQDITGAAPDPGTVPAAAKSASDAIGVATAKLKDAGVTVPSKGLVPTLTALVSALNDEQTQNKSLTDSVAAAKQAQTDAQKALADHDADRDKQIADIRTQTAADEQKINDQMAANQAVVAQLQKDAADAAAKNQQLSTQQQAQLTAAQRQLTQASDTIHSAELRLGMRRPDVSNAAIRQADGRIVRITAGNTCYINLGQGDQVSPGLTFQVYGAAEGVPGIPPNATGDEQLPVGKASIEVVRVGATSSECRIVAVTPGTVLQEGDLIENLVYDPNTKYKFFVFGNFDLAGTGRPNPADTQVIDRLVTQWGGQLVTAINVDTDFVVLGAEPTVPDYTPEELQQPLYADRAAKAQQLVDKYHELEQQAKDLHIPILNQNRFLYYVGYYDLAKR